MMPPPLPGTLSTRPSVWLATQERLAKKPGRPSRVRTRSMLRERLREIAGRLRKLADRARELERERDVLAGQLEQLENAA